MAFGWVRSPAEADAVEAGGGGGLDGGDDVADDDGSGGGGSSGVDFEDEEPGLDLAGGDSEDGPGGLGSFQEIGDGVGGDGEA